MKLTVLGCWAPYPRPEEACSGYLLQTGSTALMLESGHGSFARLVKHIDYRKLTGVLITHYHPDHYADIYCLRHAVSAARRDDRMNNTIKLFVPPAPVEIYHQLASYTDAFYVINIEELPIVELPGTKLDTNNSPDNKAQITKVAALSPTTGAPSGFSARVARLNELNLYFIPTMHGLPGYAVLIRDEKKSFFFSSDTAFTCDIVKAAYNADLLLCEASGLDKDAEYLAGKHMTARQAGKLANQAGVTKLVLTHFWPEYNIEKLLAQAGQSFGGAIFAAKQDAVFHCF